MIPSRFGWKNRRRQLDFLSKLREQEISEPEHDADREEHECLANFAVFQIGNMAVEQDRRLDFAFERIGFHLGAVIDEFFYFVVPIRHRDRGRVEVITMVEAGVLSVLSPQWVDAQEGKCSAGQKEQNVEAEKHKANRLPELKQVCCVFGWLDNLADGWDQEPGQGTADGQDDGRFCIGKSNPFRNCMVSLDKVLGTLGDREFRLGIAGGCLGTLRSGWSGEGPVLIGCFSHVIGELKIVEAK